MQEDLRLGNYSPIRSSIAGQWLTSPGYFPKSPDQLGPEPIHSRLLNLLSERKLAGRTLQGHRSALKFPCTGTLKLGATVESACGQSLATSRPQPSSSQSGLSSSL